MSAILNPGAAFGDTDRQHFFQQLQGELESGLDLYRTYAEDILGKSGITLKKPSKAYFSLENNFFSALFLYSYFRGGISKPKRILYAALNQCLRGMVTGCDNLLDNEYKKTLDTDLPVHAVKFRSILDIMVSDRILVAVLHNGARDGEFPFDCLLQANTASLHSLLRSGVQEASEEQGTGEILTPEEILRRIHPLKTGILFQAPWVLPELMETRKAKHIAEIKEGLFRIGMGCQIMDDMVDLSMDAQMNRHNYVFSLIWHGKNTREKDVLLAEVKKESRDPDLLFNFPAARSTAAEKALSLLKKGTELLFDKNHRFMVDCSIDFFARRIGADRFFHPERTHQK